MRLTLKGLIEIILLYLNKKISMSDFRRLTLPYRNVYKKKYPSV